MENIVFRNKIQPNSNLFSNKRYSLRYHVNHYLNYSTVTGSQPNVSNNSVIPVVVYSDSFLNKYHILNDNKNKAGIYRWVNKVNGNTYIGSSINLSRRFRVYYDFSFLSVRQQKSKSLIYSAILKYGYSNFQLEILEYCTK